MTQTTPKVKTAAKAKQDTKAYLMKLILEDKEVLLGKFGPPGSDLTHEKQMEKWDEVRDKAIENGYADLAGKTADYVRYHVYSQFKTRTVQKFDKSKATGSTVRKFTEVSFF
jgi:hypothetical protein